jgi:hypothetical protein
MRAELQQIERKLLRIQREFPELFVSTAPVVLLKAEARTDGRAWPLAAPAAVKNPKQSAAMKASWTPKRRKEASARMKKQRASLMVGRAKKNATRGDTAWSKMHAALLAAPDNQATVQEICAAAGISGVAVANALDYHEDIFKRVSPGVYRLKAAGKNGTHAEA